MKKYIVFVISFIVLLTLFQVLAGMLLTFTYTPDILHAWNMSVNLPQETAMMGSHSPFLITLLTAFLAASIAYMISNKMKKHSRRD